MNKPDKKWDGYAIYYATLSGLMLIVIGVQVWKAWGV